jgi:membrane-bound lytic murein transglycosylase D
VPAFIAATYICTYFGEHSIEPEYPELDAQLTDYMAVYEGMSFSAIADATGLSYQTVANLNPGFKRSYVPPSTKGYYVTLPRRVMPAFIRYLNSLGGRQYKLDAGEYTPTGALGDGRYFQTTVTVKEVDFVERFAAKNNLSAAQVRAWNKLPNNFVYPDQQLKIWNPVLVQKHSKERIEAPAPKVKKVDNFTEAPAKPSEVKATKPSGAGDAAKSPVAKQKEYQWHTVGRNESLSDVARRYGVSTDALMLLNNTADVKAGMRLKIKELK